MTLKDDTVSDSSLEPAAVIDTVLELSAHC